MNFIESLLGTCLHLIYSTVAVDALRKLAFYSFFFAQRASGVMIVNWFYSFRAGLTYACSIKMCDMAQQGITCKSINFLSLYLKSKMKNRNELTFTLNWKRIHGVHHFSQPSFRSFLQKSLMWMHCYSILRSFFVYFLGFSVNFPAVWPIDRNYWVVNR